MPGGADDKQFPKRITLPTLGGKAGASVGKASNPFMKQDTPPATPGASGVTWNPLTQRGPFSGSRSQLPAYGPLTSGYVQSPTFLATKGAFSGVTAGGQIGAGASTMPFASQYTDTSYGGQQDIYRGGTPRFNRPAGAGTGTGAGAGPGLHPDEVKWKTLADKYGVDWNVTKSVYMRSPRNPDFSPSVALNLQLRDKDWGDAARAAGILTGNPDWDNQVWIDHYNAGGDMNKDPMAGHNYAQMAYEANKARTDAMINGTPQPPEWLT